MLKYFPFGEYAHLDLVAEAFNLFNHPNVAEINPYFGSGALPLPGFGAPVGSYGETSGIFHRLRILSRAAQ